MTVKNAAHVKVYRLPGVDNLFDGDTIKSVVDTNTDDELSPTLAKTLREILLDSASYRKSAKLCWPDYAMRIQFADGQKTVDVLFCFDCSMLKIYQNGRAVVGVQDFDPAHPRLARLAKDVFPEDAMIQSISMDACGLRRAKPGATMPDAPANPAR